MGVMTSKVGLKIENTILRIGRSGSTVSVWFHENRLIIKPFDGKKHLGKLVGVYNPGKPGWSPQVFRDDVCYIVNNYLEEREIWLQSP